MKYISLLITIVFLYSPGHLLAAPPTPITQAPLPPLVQAINHRVKNQMKLTLEGVKSGKLTKAQAQGVRISIKKVRFQEFNFFKQNKSRTLTSDQINQINQSLNNNSTLLGETPVTTNS